MTDCISILPETWRRVFSYCDAEVLCKFLLAGYHSNSQVHLIAREMAIVNLENRFKEYFRQGDGKDFREEKMMRFITCLSKSECSARNDGYSSVDIDQSLKCCVLWAYIDYMISFNENKCSHVDDKNGFQWIIATGPLMADFYESSDDSSSQDEVMDVYISTPLSWDPAILKNMNGWMRRGVHTNMYVTPLFSEDSVQNCAGLVVQVDQGRDIHSYSFMHGDMGDPRWSHALVLGENGQHSMSIWADIHPRMESHLQEKFGNFVWMLESAKTSPHVFLCTWQESMDSCDDHDSDTIIYLLKEMLIRLKRYNLQNSPVSQR